MENNGDSKKRKDKTMNKIFISITIICSLSLMATFAYAKVSQEYLRWADGDFNMPSEIKDINNISELQPFLNNKDEFIRMAAVRRLGEVENDKTINLLQEIFAKEPNTGGLDDFPLVKLEVIRTLRRIDGENAKSTLLNLLENFWTRGPNVEDKKYFYYDRDFEPVVSLTLEELCIWSNDDSVYQTAQNIAFSEDVNKLYSHRIGKNAWILYLKGDMPRKGIKSDRESAKYLLDLINDIEEEGITSSEFGPVKREAAKAIFEQHSKEVLTSLQRKLEEDIAKIPYNEPNGSMSKHHYRLRSQISYIEKVLREKEAQKAEQKQ